MHERKQRRLRHGESQKDRDGKLANGAIANIVDVVGGSVVQVEGLPLCFSVDISISFLSTANLHVSNQFHLSHIGLPLGFFFFFFFFLCASS
ncbi:hypothetical protein FEM48_Zijuj02G0058500 [Ziziphus jujuba var. spinosa]|uniref:Uncharacterized protein n=1 Tax=Ziziphus jujuba var. spinosa TaxID=714518 RepID=A0A978VU02_ZIZJJ|nr:hypothetical protein FEM48_Zijuj02G0058500 [Ziziphus jujuba var. spinosa]